MTPDTLPGPPALDDRLARWVGLGAACAVLLLIVLFAGWAASLPGGLLAAVPAVSRFELREVAPGDPDGRGPGGRLVEARERLTLPAFIRTDGDQSLHRAVFEIDLDPFIGPEDGFDPARDGDPATAHRPPAKSLVLSQAINGADIYLNGVWINGLAQSSARARFRSRRMRNFRRTSGDSSPGGVSVPSAMSRTRASRCWSISRAMCRRVLGLAVITSPTCRLAMESRRAV